MVIRPDVQRADLAQGYALAETREEVYEMVDHPDAMVFWKHPETPWPGKHGERLIWTSGWRGQFVRARLH